MHILLTSCWTAWLHALALPAHSRTLSDEEEWWWRSSVWSSLTSHRRSGVDRRMVQQIEAAACWAQPPHNAIYKLTRAVEDFFTFMPPQWWQRRADTQSQRSTTQGWVLNSQFLKLLISSGLGVYVPGCVLDINHQIIHFCLFLQQCHCCLQDFSNLTSSCYMPSIMPSISSHDICCLKFYGNTRLEGDLCVDAQQECGLFWSWLLMLF